MMKYKIYRLEFTTAVHFGNGRLGSSDSAFFADRLFSAICIEAKKRGGAEEIEKLVNAAKNGRILISDGMPYIGSTLYVPKPIVHIESADSGNSAVKKAFKKLNYVPADKLETYLAGKLDAGSEAEKLSGLGKRTEKTAAAIFEGDDAKPYRVGTYEFSGNCGLYFIIGYEDEDVFDVVCDLTEALGYDGIGGKISAGLGKFEARMCDVPDIIVSRLNGDHSRYMSLSVCMAKDNELEKALENASYAMVKRSGFIYSQSYADTFVKKKNMYCFAAGSCFGNRFEGDVFNVGGKGTHPVYRYAKPMLMGVFA